MAIDFPNSPTTGDFYTVDDRTWRWDGYKWAIYATNLSQSNYNAKGDLVVGTGNDTVGTLPAGTTGQYLTANSGASVGLEWTTINLSSYATITGGETLTNKTIALGSNTVSGTLAQFNTAVTDADFASLAGSETLTNKTITGASVDRLTENWNVVATIAPSTTNLDVKTASVWYFSSSTGASTPFTLNIRGDSSTTLSSHLAVGKSITVVLAVATSTSTNYYPNVIRIDNGVLNYQVNVTAKWQGGTAPTAGNSSGIDVYTLTIVKTNDPSPGTTPPTYTVFASQALFK
jgi:hypothetical protein